MVKKCFKAFRRNTGLAYVIAALVAIVVYMGTQRDDSLMNVALRHSRKLLLDIGERGMWTWSFDLLYIES